MDVSVIIVSFNTRELTIACIGSIFEQTANNLAIEVIVVDNASGDGSADLIAERFPQVRLVPSATNAGFAKANNLAAEFASGRYVLLLNPDTIILDDAIGRVVRFADEHLDVGIAGGRTLFGDGTFNPNSCHGVPTVWSLLCMGSGLSSLFRRSWLFDPESLGGWERDTIREVDAVTGCFLLIRRELWNSLGGFDESFFMYGEDTDLCIRAWKAGSKCMICPDARLIHYGGKSEKLRADKMVKLFRAKAQLIEKHWDPGIVWFGLAMLKLWAFTRMLAFGGASMIIASLRRPYMEWREIWSRRCEYGRNPRTV